MKRPDYLSEFGRHPERPGFFKVVSIQVLLTVSVYVILVYPTIRYNLFEKYRFELWPLYFYSLLLVYPLIGNYGYWNHKMYGWFILSHYSLSSAAIIVFISVFDGISFQTTDGVLFYVKFCSFVFVFCLNIFCLVSFLTKDTPVFSS